MRLSEGRVEIQGDGPFEAALSRDGLDSTLQAVAEAALAREHVSGPDHVTVIVTGDETLRRLNREFTGEDEVTDVLSFNATPGAAAGVVPEAEAGWTPGPGEPPPLGDVIISLPAAERQAQAAGHALARELATLTAHGVLHLLGYDHADGGERDVMFGKTDRILEATLGPARDAGEANSDA